MDKNLVSCLGDYCRRFRYLELNATLRDVASKSGSNQKALSSFEHGRANNILHIVSYIVACETEEQKTTFYADVDKLISDFVVGGEHNG